MSQRVPEVKVIHKAALINEDGEVSALCYKRPRRIDLRRSTWTIRDHAVTCENCIAVLKARGVDVRKIVLESKDLGRR